MGDGHDRPHGEAEAEPQADVDQDPGHRQQEGVDPPALQLGPDHRADDVLLEQLEGTQVGLLDGANHGERPFLETAALLTLDLREANLDFVGIRVAGPSDDLLTRDAVERAPHRLFGHRLLEPEQDERAPGEVDAQGQPLPDDHRADAAEDDRRR